VSSGGPCLTLPHRLTAAASSAPVVSVSWVTIAGAEAARQRLAQGSQGRLGFSGGRIHPLSPGLAPLII
jgi:hypothetical protein